MRTHAAHALLVLAIAGLGPAAGAAELGFVHVEGNVAGASGGHTALQVGADAFHFEVHPDGTFRLRREPWAFFVHRYSVLQNRPLHWLRVALPTDDEARVRAAAVHLHLDQQRALAHRERTRRDLALAAAWRGDSPSIDVPRAGFFDPARTGDPIGTGLRARIEAERGPDFLATRLRALEADLAAESGATLERTRERIAEREAFRALAGAWGLADGSLRAPRRDARLVGHERAALGQRADAFAVSAAALLDSGRPDRGHALLLTLARHHAAERALEENRLLLLDAMPEEPPQLGPRAARLRHAELSALSAHLDDLVQIQRRRALTADPGAGQWALLESLVSRGEEYALGAEFGLAVREPAGRLLPALAREVSVSRPPLSEDALRVVHETAAAAAAEASRAVLERWPYDLFEHNCATELIRLVEHALGGPARVEAVLGGELDPDAGLVFVPRVWREQIRQTAAGVAYERIPAYRERALDELRKRKSPARVYARESNTVTATTYRWRDRDTRFLLFTDDVFWPRPLYGALNLGWALADASFGLVTAPFDRGRRVVRGAWGALYSVPELVFQNVRKGSFDAATLPAQLLGPASRTEPHEDLPIAARPGDAAL